MQPSLTERYRGALLGLACGDAVGTSVAFQPQGSFKPLTDMEGGGPLAGSSDPNTAGNGSLMRLAPMVLYCFPDRDRLLELSANSSRTTHAAPEALECCQLFAELIHNALQGARSRICLDSRGHA